jgi:hypothetical protein
VSIYNQSNASSRKEGKLEKPRCGSRRENRINKRRGWIEKRKSI